MTMPGMRSLFALGSSAHPSLEPAKRKPAFLHPVPALILRLNRQKGNLKRKVFGALPGGTR